LTTNKPPNSDNKAFSWSAAVRSICKG